MDDLSEFERLAADRKTIKVMAREDFPLSDDRQLIERLLSCAGRAPFHKACSPEHRQPGGLEALEPWRFYAVDSLGCRRLRGIIESLEAAGKIPAMLAAARALILATWLPNPASSPPSVDSEHFEATVANAEHIAATAAAVQSLLLAATAARVASYWSSGGVLRSPDVLQQLRIPCNQRLLGAVFPFPQPLPEQPSADCVDSVVSQRPLEVGRGGSLLKC